MGMFPGDLEMAGLVVGQALWVMALWVVGVSELGRNSTGSHS